MPTFKEAGYPAVEGVEWFGVFVPAGTPAEIVNALNNAIHQALKSDELKAGLTKLSFEIAGAAPGDFAQLIKSDTERWGSVVKASGFKPVD